MGQTTGFLDISLNIPHLVESGHEAAGLVSDGPHKPRRVACSVQPDLVGREEAGTDLVGTDLVGREEAGVDYAA